MPIETRYDLIPYSAMKRLSLIYAEGAKSYGPSAYLEDGHTLPFSSILNHMHNHLEKYLSGDRSEDHLAKCAWAFFTMMVLEAHRPVDNDLFHHGVRPECTKQSSGPS